MAATAKLPMQRLQLAATANLWGQSFTSCAQGASPSCSITRGGRAMWLGGSDAESSDDRPCASPASSWSTDVDDNADVRNRVNIQESESEDEFSSGSSEELYVSLTNTEFLWRRSNGQGPRRPTMLSFHSFFLPWTMTCLRTKMPSFSWISSLSIPMVSLLSMSNARTVGGPPSNRMKSEIFSNRRVEWADPADSNEDTRAATSPPVD